MRYPLLLALTCVAGAALAQVQPIPDRSITKPSSPLSLPSQQPITPVLPPRPPAPGAIQLPAPRPQIMLVSAAPAIGVPSVLRFRVANLGPATAIHLYDFSPGCALEQTPGVVGLSFRIDREGALRGNSSAYTTSFDPREAKTPRRLYDSRGPEGEPIPVSGGSAEVVLQGVPGVPGGKFLVPEEVRGPDPQSLMERNALGRYRRIVGDGTTCDPTAFVMVRDPDGIWRVLNPDGSRNETFRADGSAKRIGGPSYNLRARQKITFGSTAALKDTLGAFMTGPLQSACQGVSSGIGQPDYRVGMFERDGDLVFRIRSGPNGTRCIVRMQLTDLPAGSTASARFSVTRDGTRCRVGDGSLLNEVLGQYLTLFAFRGAFQLDRSTQMLMAPVAADAGTFEISRNGWLNPYSAPTGTERFNWQTSASPVAALLFCEATLVNDHGIELRMDSMEISVPDGVSYDHP